MSKSEEKSAWLAGILKDLGPSMSHLRIEDVIAVARVGSFLYGLHTPTSDIDYVIIFRNNTQVIFCLYFVSQIML